MRLPKRFRHNLLLLASLLGLTGLSGCALSPSLQKWEADYYWTERLYMDGQNELAVQRFAALRKQATDPRDADEAALMECEVQSRAGQHAPATACYDQLATSAIDKSMRARAVLHAAELRFYNLHLERDGLNLWQALVQKSTDEPAALRALDHLTLYGELDAAKREQMIALFRKWEVADPDSEIADNLLLRAAELLERDGERAALVRAAQLLEREGQRHPYDASNIDCLEARARVYQKLGEYQLEARDLEKILEAHETSYVFASYGFDEQKAAALRLVELYRGPVLDLQRAEFHARNLPEMLHKPVKLPAYLITAAEIAEQRGQRMRALQTYRSVLSYVVARNKDYRDNDRRICGELDSSAERQGCLNDIKGSSDIEPKECDIARTQIARLEQELRQPQPWRDDRAGKPISTGGAP